MCGIAGILELDKNKRPSQEGLRRMAGVLTHRGPDEEGIYQSGPVGLAHRRLSIIDLASGQQPMKSPDGKICLVFNGEIYNYLELKTDLEERGYLFRTQSDTEVLLALYQHYGLDAFPKINGMFACAFWDDRSKELVLSRDRFGKKPLLFYSDSNRFMFASEIKAILAYGGIERNVSLSAMHEYLTRSFIGGEQTIIEGVKRLLPAHVMVVQNNLKIRSQSYWKLRYKPGHGKVDESEVVDQLGGLLKQAVRRRLISDVPLGAFLSGGLDSSTVVALMAQLSDRPVKTFSIGFEEAGYSELDDARVVARHLGTDHHEIVVKPSAMDILEDLVWHLDEPFGDSSAVPTYYVCQAARKYVTVALSGDGGDEIFAGYKRYQKIESYSQMRHLPTWLRQFFIGPASRIIPFTWPGWNTLYALGKGIDHEIPYGLGIFPYIQRNLYSADLNEHVKDCDPYGPAKIQLKQISHLDPVSRYQYMDTLQYLPADILTKVDRMSMAVSLEVRAPLLDYTVVEYMAELPVSMKLRDHVSKYVLRKFANQLLPPSVFEKHKQGFALPTDVWFKKELRSYARDILLDPMTIGRGYFHKKTLERLLEHHVNGRRDYSTWIWCLIVLETWFRLFIDKRHDI